MIPEGSARSRVRRIVRNQRVDRVAVIEMQTVPPIRIHRRYPVIIGQSLASNQFFNGGSLKVRISPYVRNPLLRHGIASLRWACLNAILYRSNGSVAVATIPETRDVTPYAWIRHGETYWTRMSIETALLPLRLGRTGPKKDCFRPSGFLREFEFCRRHHRFENVSHLFRTIPGWRRYQVSPCSSSLAGVVAYISIN